MQMGGALQPPGREPLEEPGEFWLVALARAHGLKSRLLLYEFDSVVAFGSGPESLERGRWLATPD